MYPESVQLWCKLFLDVKCIKPFPSVVSLVGISLLHCFLLILCWWGWTWDRSRCFCDWAGVRKGFYRRMHQGCEEEPRLSSLLTLATGPWPHHLRSSLSSWHDGTSSLCPEGFCQLGRALRRGKKWGKKRKSDIKKVSTKRRKTQDSEEGREKKEEMRLNMGRRLIVFAAKCL